MRGVIMRGRSDKVTLFASPPELATEMGLSSTIVVIKDLIKNAKETIFITCYEFSSDELADEIITAVAREVNVDVYIDESDSGSPENRISRSKDNLEKMEDVGVRIVRQNNTMRNHTKAIIVDSDSGVIGSANFTWSGLNKNIEIGLKIEGPSCELFMDKFISGLEAMNGNE